MNSRKIDILTEGFIRSENDETFNQLVNEIIPIINQQLLKNYSSKREFWGDIRQDVLLKIWKNRGNIKHSLTERPYQYFYNRIRDYLNRSAKGYDKYDSINPDISSLEDINHNI